MATVTTLNTWTHVKKQKRRYDRIEEHLWRKNRISFILQYTKKDARDGDEKWKFLQKHRHKKEYNLLRNMTGHKNRIGIQQSQIWSIQKGYHDLIKNKVKWLEWIRNRVISSNSYFLPGQWQIWPWYFQMLQNFGSAADARYKQSLKPAS